jgi:hypothetical protein
MIQQFCLSHTPSIIKKKYHYPLKNSSRVIEFI